MPDVASASPAAAAAPAQRRFAASPVGVLLLDSGLRPVYYNAEAANILRYPAKAPRPFSLEGILSATRAQLASHSNPAAPSRVELTSGRRRYLCRTFVLDANGNADTRFHPKVLVIVERECTQPVDITQWSDDFQLTCRERETVTFLLRGLTSKEIAEQMSISPNTVKSFLKLVMAKVGAPTRTGIVAKILERAISDVASRSSEG